MLATSAIHPMGQALANSDGDVAFCSRRIIVRRSERRNHEAPTVAYRVGFDADSCELRFLPGSG